MFWFAAMFLLETGGRDVCCDLFGNEGRDENRDSQCVEGVRHFANGPRELIKLIKQEQKVKGRIKCMYTTGAVDEAEKCGEK